MPNTSSVYIIDTSSFIDMKLHYPTRAFPTFWENFESLVREGQIQSPITVFEEISRKDDELTEWTRINHDRIFYDHTPSILEKVEEILAVFPKLIDENKENDQADPFVIAMAIDKRIQQSIEPQEIFVVTEERINPHRRTQKIPMPLVCQHFGVPYLTILDLILSEGWTF
jgi:hypothetical protein